MVPHDALLATGDGALPALGGALLLVAALAALALHAVLTGPRPVRVTRWMVGGGLVLPALVAAALFVPPTGTGGSAPLDAAHTAALRVEVNARQWWWEVRYVGAY